MRCSDGQSLAAQRMFGVCSNDIINQAYTKLGEEDFAQEQDGGATETEEDNSKEMADTAERMQEQFKLPRFAFGLFVLLLIE